MNPKINIGTDIIEIERFRGKPLEANMSFYNSIFNKSELLYCMKYSDPYPHFAGTYAAKEAIMKCLKLPLRMLDIQITRNLEGKPTANITSTMKKNTNIKISISHATELAIAVAVIF